MSQISTKRHAGIDSLGLSRIGTAGAAASAEKAGRLECDHVVPIATTGAGLAGQWDPSNLQTLCRNCHFIKSHKERNGARFGLQTPMRSAWDVLVEKLLG